MQDHGRELQAEHSVLIVDDHVDSREVYATMLAFRGYATTEAVTGEAAVAAAIARPPDVILMDMSLPGGIDGWEATQRLKSDARTSAIPVIAITGHASPEDRRRAKDLGCAEYLVKPVLPTDVADAVARVLSARPA